MTTQPTNASSQRGDTTRTDTRRVRMAWFEHGSSRIYYEAQGSGTPVLLLPGLFMSIEEFSGLRDALVIAGYQVIAADLPGSGRTLGADLGRGGCAQRSQRTTTGGDLQRGGLSHPAA